MSVTFDPAKINADITLSNGNLTSTKAAAGVAADRSGRLDRLEKHRQVARRVHAACLGVGRIMSPSASATALRRRPTGSARPQTASGSIRTALAIATAPALSRRRRFRPETSSRSISTSMRGSSGSRTSQPPPGYNAGGTADPATGVGGLSIVVTGALFVAMSGSGVTDSAKVNFGVQTLAGTVPSGFSLIDTASNVTVSSTLGAVVASATLVERDPISIGATLAAVVSSIALRETDPLSIGATLAAVVASISLAETDTLTASPTLGPVVGAVSLTMTDPLSVASTLAPVVSSIALVNGAITSDLTIGATLDPVISAIALVNPSSAAGRPKRPKKQRYTFPNGVTVISSSYEMAKLVAQYGQAEPEPEADEPEAEAPVEIVEDVAPAVVEVKVAAPAVAPAPDPAIAARRKAEDAELFEAAQRLLALRRAEEEAILMLLLEDG
jgi:hypothetical protein